VLGNEAFRQRAASVGAGLKEAGGVKAAVDRLETLALAHKKDFMA
jgi:hypothetical protein